MIKRVWQRVASLALIVVVLPFLVVLAPVLVPVLALADLATGRRDLPLPRLYLFAIVFFVGEWLGQIAAVGVWLVRVIGRRDTFAADWFIQQKWADLLFRWARRLLNVRFDVPNIDTLPKGEFIVLSRHSCMVDAIVPLWIVATHGRRYVHYVIKRELLWVPNLRVYGTRLINHFVTRGGDTERERNAIEDMARLGKPNSGYVIFPEGTYGTEANRQRVLRSLAKDPDSEMFDYANKLQHLLPPKSAGTLSLLRARPNASVLILGHSGLAGLAELKGLRANLPAKAPMVIKWWSHDRSTIPATDVEAERWLRERWTDLDVWASNPPRADLTMRDSSNDR